MRYLHQYIFKYSHKHGNSECIELIKKSYELLEHMNTRTEKETEDHRLIFKKSSDLRMAIPTRNTPNNFRQSYKHYV